MSAADEKLQDMTAPTAACGTGYPPDGFKTALEMKQEDDAATDNAARSWYALVRGMAQNKPLKVSRALNQARFEAGLPTREVELFNTKEAHKQTFHDIPDYGSPEATQEFHTHANYAATVSAYSSDGSSKELLF